MKTPDFAKPIKDEVTHNGFLKLHTRVLKVGKFNGGTMNMPRELLKQRPAVSILPYDPNTGMILTIRQFLQGTWEAGLPAWPRHLISGMIDDQNELPSATAIREAEEEAGIAIDQNNLIHALDYISSPGICSEKTTIFIAKFDSSTYDPGINGLESENEDIRSELVKLDDALAELDRGEITSASAIIALQYLDRHRGKIAA